MFYKKLPLILFFFLTSCMGSGYEKFYTDYTDSYSRYNEGSKDFIEFYEGEPKVYSSTDLEKDALILGREGYIIVGYSSFNGPVEKTKNAQAQGKRVGAEIVLIKSKYTDTVSGSIPFTTPTTTTSTTSQSGSVYGTVGTTPYSGTYSGTGYTTTYGTQTTYIPYNVRRYDQTAAYFAKLKVIILGVLYAAEVPTEIRRAIGSNEGIFVAIVIKDTPAFYVGILEGDLITTVNNISIFSINQMNKILRETAGEEVKIEVFRQGNYKQLKIKLNAG